MRSLRANHVNTKTYHTLELNKILARLATYASFSASEALLLELEPTPHFSEAQRRQQETTEARDLLEERSTVSIGGARDVRPAVQGAQRSVLLNPTQLLEIRATLQSAAALKRTLLQSEARYPLLAEQAYLIDECRPVVNQITQVIDEEGQVLDSASPALLRIRGDLRVAHDRLHTKLQSIVNSSANAPYLQEALITMRAGRYVIPVKAEARGRIKGIVHDQSSSGATVFIEPLATVEINNTIRELELAEDEEVRRILAEITALIGTHAEAIVRTVGALAALDAAFARAKYANALKASPPVLIDFDPGRSPGSTIRLYSARHPLLDPGTVVPIDVDLDDETFIVVVTGPNTGGKTVSLKTVGLLVLMAQCGLHLPAAEGSVLSVFEAIYADIGDEQSIEQSLSTFSSHLTNIIGILGKADSRSMVLLDELGAGTDPAEGSALARALLAYFLERRVTTFATTHYPDLKLYAHNTPGVRNASVEFDVETLSPTYRLIIGLPGRSNALAIAERLGLDSAIIEAARSYVSEEDLEADTLLDEIHRTRDEIRQAQARLVKAESEARALREELEHRLDQIEEERAAVLEQTRSQAEEELEVLRLEIGTLRRRMQTMAPAWQPAPTGDADSVAALEVEAAGLADLVQAPPKRRHRRPRKGRAEVKGEPPQRALRPGDQVYVHGLNAEGEIMALHAGHDVEVQIGQLRVRVDADSLEWRAGPTGAAGTPRSEGVRSPRPESPGMELNLLGYLVEDALPAVEEYLDQAYLAGLPWVHLVHGHGTGALRRAIRDRLRQHPLVKEYSRAPENQGGDGVTVVRFVSNS